MTEIYGDPRFESIEDLVEEILKLRNAIRKHRDATGHNRCWLNDVELYKVLPENKEGDFNLPPLSEFLPECIKYWKSQTDDR